MRLRILFNINFQRQLIVSLLFSLSTQHLIERQNGKLNTPNKKFENEKLARSMLSV